MNVATFTIGIVCTGNTCRSPITAAWLRHHLSSSPPRSEVQVWTAGLSLGKSTKVTPEPFRIAQELRLNGNEVTKLRKHRARPLTSEMMQTNLLVWITDPNQLHALDAGLATRAERMRDKAKALGATLLVIPESDEPWYAKKQKKSPEEIARLYRKQSRSLRSWANVVRGFIP